MEGDAEKLEELRKKLRDRRAEDEQRLEAFIQSTLTDEELDRDRDVIRQLAREARNEVAAKEKKADLWSIFRIELVGIRLAVLVPAILVLAISGWALTRLMREPEKAPPQSVTTNASPNTEGPSIAEVPKNTEGPPIETPIQSMDGTRSNETKTGDNGPQRKTLDSEKTKPAHPDTHSNSGTNTPPHNKPLLFLHVRAFTDAASIMQVSSAFFSDLVAANVANANTFTVAQVDDRTDPNDGLDAEAIVLTGKVNRYLVVPENGIFILKSTGTNSPVNARVDIKDVDWSKQKLNVECEVSLRIYRRQTATSKEWISRAEGIGETKTTETASSLGLSSADFTVVNGIVDGKAMPWLDLVGAHRVAILKKTTTAAVRQLLEDFATKTEKQ